jgi:NAD(P)-dependent dehydrogenase (short-subunit alcohol dehydrogenase family)
MGILDGKVILITGAASGIGQATAMEAHAEGARLALCDIDAEAGDRVAAEINDDGGDASFTRCDVTSEADVEMAVTLARDRLGRLDGAFNCAGILGTVALTAETSLDNWKRILEVDLSGVFLCTKHQLRVMMQQRSGAVLNMASAAGLIGWEGAAGYVAAKHGVVGLTKTAALEVAAIGVRVNAICPSYTLTPMVADLFDNVLAGDQELIDGARAKHPIGRFAHPDEIARAAVWLLSDKASFVTGAAMSVDGGYTAP